MSEASAKEDWDDYKIEERRVADLVDHAESATIFGVPRESAAFIHVRDAIKKWGLTEPLIIKTDGTILSGHLRKYALIDSLGADAKARVRVHPGFGSYREEVEFIIDANTKRRQLTMREIARAYRRLTTLAVEDGGEKRKRGRPSKGSASGTISSSQGKSGAAAAARLKVGKHTARALDIVFNTPGVPKETQDAVERGEIKPTVAAKAIVAERIRPKAHGAAPDSATRTVVTKDHPPSKIAGPRGAATVNRERESLEAFRTSADRLMRLHGWTLEELVGDLRLVSLTSITKARKAPTAQVRTRNGESTPKHFGPNPFVVEPDLAMGRGEPL